MTGDVNGDFEFRRLAPLEELLDFLVADLLHSFSFSLPFLLSAVNFSFSVL